MISSISTVSAPAPAIWAGAPGQTLPKGAVAFVGANQTLPFHIETSPVVSFVGAGQTLPFHIESAVTQAHSGVEGFWAGPPGQHLPVGCIA